MTFRDMGRGATVILAAGDFPRKGGEAWRLLASARRVVACDGAAEGFRRRFGRWPSVIVGDLDSLPPRSVRAVRAGTEVVHVPDQDTNDLEKAARLCAERRWRAPVIVGATGKREDHTIGNVFRAMDLGLEIVTDSGRFVPVEGSAHLRVGKGTPVSVFAPDPATRVVSKGLEWPLDGVSFENLHCATLNRASSSVVTLTTTHRICVFTANRLQKQRTLRHKNGIIPI